MSIIYNVRINQDIDKDGKYVCDLNPKEETKFDKALHKAMSSNTSIVGKFVWSEKGVEPKDTSITYNPDNVISPADFMDAAVAWFEGSKAYKWKFTHTKFTRETYLTLIISQLEKLV